MRLWMCPQSAACWPIQLGKFHICTSRTFENETIRTAHSFPICVRKMWLQFRWIFALSFPKKKKKCNENGWFYLCSTVAHGCTFPISSRKICDSPAGGGNRRGRSDIMSTRLLFSRRGFAYATECLPSSQYVSTRRIRNKLNKCNHQWQID